MWLRVRFLRARACPSDRGHFAVGGVARRSIGVEVDTAMSVIAEQGASGYTASCSAWGFASRTSTGAIGLQGEGTGANPDLDVACPRSSFTSVLCIFLAGIC